MTLLPCARCATPAPAEALACPHCGTSLQPGTEAEIRALPLILLSLGLSLAGCGDKEEDDTGGGDDTNVQALYGVAESIEDDDGAS